ncbi:MAG: hypothetical protein KGH84_05570 [Paracoccaceae bacterium]|nr:hypothetical protein [Paracoccaceae bacterium]
MNARHDEFVRSESGAILFDWLLLSASLVTLIAVIVITSTGMFPPTTVAPAPTAQSVAVNSSVGG